MSKLVDELIGDADNLAGEGIGPSQGLLDVIGVHAHGAGRDLDVELADRWWWKR